MENNKIISGIVINSQFHKKKITADITYKENGYKKPLVLFVHGFKGFKDWGHFPLIAHYFGHHDFVFAKMNLSHNGTTPDALVDFTDLEAFGQNNFTIETADINSMIDHLTGKDSPVPAEDTDPDRLYLTGHSRGGSSVLIQAIEDDRVRGCVTWAAVTDIISRYAYPDDATEWKEKGVKYIYNGRTDQQMPLEYQLAQDLIHNKARFDIKERLKHISKPVLLIHGKNDETVPLSDPQSLEGINENIDTKYIDGSHTFDGAHPWTEATLPESSKVLCDETIRFLHSLK